MGGSCHFFSQPWLNTQGREQSSPIYSTVLTEMAWRRDAKLNFLFSKELPQFSLFNITSCHNNLSPKNVTSPRPCSWPTACLTFQGFFGYVHLITWLEGPVMCADNMPQAQMHRPRAAGAEGPPAPQVPASSRDATPTIWTWTASCVCLLPTSTPLLHQRPHAGHTVTSALSVIVSRTPPEDQPQSTHPTDQVPRGEPATSSYGPWGSLHFSQWFRGVVSPLAGLCGVHS